MAFAKPIDDPTNPLNSGFITSYTTLRKAIGWLGILMPIIIRLGAYFFEGIRSNESISAYYYTGMRDIFVGTLCANGLFLLCYRTHDTWENILTNVAGIAAIGIGLLPMEPLYHSVTLEKFPAMKAVLENQAVCYQNHGPLGYHIYAVTIFFVAISILTIFFFTKPSQHPPVNPGKKKQRNKIYVVCGIVMLLSLGSIIGLKLFSANQSIFWPETFAVIAFGIAWLAKGKAIMKD
jgi:hypothetical protein